MPGSLQQRTELELFRKPTYRDLCGFEKIKCNTYEEKLPYILKYVQQLWETLEIKTEFSKRSTLMETE